MNVNLASESYPALSARAGYRCWRTNFVPCWIDVSLKG